LRNVEKNNNFISNVVSVPGLAEYLDRITVTLAILNQRRALNTVKSTSFQLIGQAERLQNLISSIERNAAAERNAARARAQRQANANARAGQRLEEQAAKAKKEAAAERNAARARAQRQANANARAGQRLEEQAAKAKKEAAAANAAKRANAHAHAANNASKRVKEAEQKRINLVNEHIQKAEKLLLNTRAKLNNINKNNEYTIKNESINKYAKLYENYFKNMNSIYKNIIGLTGKHPHEQFSGLNERAMNLMKRIANGFNASHVAMRRNTAAAAQAERAARAANRGLTGNAKMRQNILSAQSKLANHIAKGTPDNLREARDLERRIKLLEKKLSK